MDRHTTIIVMLFVFGLSWTANGTKQDQHLEKLSEEVKKLQARVGHLEVRDRQYEDIINYVEKQRANNYIGFTAYTNEDLTVASGDEVTMTSTLTNYGEAFSGGAFTCPATGLYYFSVTSRTETNRWGMITIMMGDTELTTAFADYTNQDTGTNAVIIECSQGGRVFLKNTSSSTIIIEGGKENSFVGYLVQLSL